MFQGPKPGLVQPHRSQVQTSPHFEVSVVWVTKGDRSPVNLAMTCQRLEETVVDMSTRVTDVQQGVPKIIPNRVASESDLAGVKVRPC